ncbi:hypothetical protein OF83DRAFT_236494 [Amylostereum chailletii]|nr:hypothetical protein OF83DRAFT_236494 [Amylostereum chailletii]
MREMQRVDGPLHSARLCVLICRDGPHEETLSISGWLGAGQGISRNVWDPSSESRVFFLSFTVFMQALGLAEIHRLCFQRLPFEDIVTLTIELPYAHPSEDWVRILRPLQRVELLKVDGTLMNVFRAIAFGATFSESLDMDLRDAPPLFPKLSELIIANPRINGGGGSLREMLRTIAERQHSSGTTLRIAFQNCTKYSEAIDKALVGLAEVSWDSVRFWDDPEEDEDEDWLWFMR